MIDETTGGVSAQTRRRDAYRKALGLARPEPRRGVLELGLVRDSQVNSVYGYQVFGEMFERIALQAFVYGDVYVTTGDSS